MYSRTRKHGNTLNWDHETRSMPCHCGEQRWLMAPTALGHRPCTHVLQAGKHRACLAFARGAGRSCEPEHKRPGTVSVQATRVAVGGVDTFMNDQDRET